MNKVDDFLAKSNGETIRQHTDNLIKAFEEFKCLYGCLFDKNLLLAIQIACKYHDCGKCSLLFQKKIGNYTNSKENRQILDVYKANGFEDNIPHGYLSPAFIDLKETEKNIGKPLTKAVINAVYYHHNRKEEIHGRQLAKIIEADLKPRFNAGNCIYINYLYTQDISDEEWITYAIVVGMLNKMDYYASDTNDKFPVEIDGRFNDRYICDFVAENFKNKGFGLRA